MANQNIQATKISQTVAVIGGDERAIYAARILAKQGKKIVLYALEEHFMGNCAEFDRVDCKAPYLISEAIENSDVLLFPIPFSKDKKTVFTPFSREPLTVSAVEEALSNSKKKLFVAGGGLSDYRLSTHTVFDFLKQEEFLLKNALPSAEGAIGLAILHHRSVLKGCSVAVLGFGRIASLLAKKLSAMGAEVTVFARREEQRKKARGLPVKAEKLSDLSLFCADFSIIFNTIPMPFIDFKTVEKMSENSLYIELASAPYSMDEEIKKHYKGDFLPAPGLPGRYCPEYAGKVIAEILSSAIEKT